MRHNEILSDLKLIDLNPVTFGFENCKPKHSYGPAVRSYWLLHFITSGKGTFTREKKSYQISSGEIFIIPPYLETYYEADEFDPWNYIWIGFQAKEEFTDCFQSPTVRCPEAKQIFEEMKLCSKKSKGKTEFILAKLWELISLLSDDRETKTSYVETALQCMKSEYMTSLSVAEVSRRLGLDRSYFSNLFKDEIGISPGKYLNTLRLSNAAELMTKHGTTPTTAALSCGFSDIYHFSKAFKKHFGLSPRAYCERYKK